MLSGIRVLDASARLGWLAGRLLADLGADVEKIDAPGVDRSSCEWRALNVNKRVNKRLDGEASRLDLADPAGRAALESRLAGVDILIATPADGAELDAPRLLAAHPRLVVVAVTPFGLNGPKAGWRAGDIEIMAAGGAMSLAGEPDGAPMRVSAPQSYGWAGSMAAVGALTALAARGQTGRGQLVDVSAQAAVITALSHAPAFVDLLGTTPTRAGAYITGRSVKGARFRVFWPCRDGYLNFILYGGGAGRRTNEQLVAWMRERGAELGPLAGIDWAKFDPTGADQAAVDAMEAPIARFFTTLTKREFLEGAHRREMLGYPVSTVADIATDPQLEARGFWQDLARPGAPGERHCGAFVIVDGKRPALKASPEAATAQPGGSAARPGDTAARTDRTASRPERTASRPERTASRRRALRQALDGVTVVEFGSYAAGPHVGKMLANFGATVVHVESMARPDGFRLQYPPYKGGKPGLNSGGCFAIFNDSKYGVSLDLKSGEGVAQARRLVERCDVVIENMRPGVMARLGLGFEALAATNPGLVMLSTCNMGQTGPRADTPGFGSQLSALAGLCGLTGERDGPPMLLYGPYIDFIASILGAVAVLAALERRRTSGRGAWLDVSQYECGLMFLAGPLLDYHLNGRIAERRGNTDPEAAPHGVYACRDGGWLALSCRSDAERAALAAALGARGGASLEDALGAWARGRAAREAAAGLQAAGVTAHEVNTVADLFTDPQLVARRLWRRRIHPVIGEHCYVFPGFDLEQMPGDVIAPAPLLGADTERVFRELVGLSAEEYAAAQARGAFA